MKKIFAYLILISLFFNLNLFSYATNKIQMAEISKIENNLFGFDYNNQDLKERVIRLENTVYGKSGSGDLNNRLKKLANDILAEQIGSEIPPNEDTFNNEDIADSSVNYPIIDEIETKIFGETYKNRDFHTRIVTIERKLFGKIYDVENYSERMDRIKAEVMPERLAREKVFGYDNSEQDSLNSENLAEFDLFKNRRQMPYGQENYTRPYANYGDLTGASSDIPMNLNDDLAQLEYNTFGTEFSNDDTKTRLKRLNSVNKAKKHSNKYDSIKFQQRMSTVMEIGAMLLMILAMVL